MKIVKILKLSIMISAMILKMMSTTINIMKETNIMMESEGIKYSKRWKIEKNQCNWQTYWNWLRRLIESERLYY